MLRILTDDEVLRTYGDPSKYRSEDGGVSPEWATSILSSFNLPSPLPLAWGGLANKITCNKQIAPELENIFKTIRRFPDAWNSINDYGGCYNFRRIKGSPTKLSRHSWGIAIDLDVHDNPQHSSGAMHPLIVEAFYDAGWLWGGWFSEQCRDPMHFEKAAAL